MYKFICLMRGINVSGKNIIKMDALKIAFEELGFSGVKTYIQSGNVVFASKIANQLTLQTLITDKITEVFQLNIPVLVIAENNFIAIIKENIFLNNAKIDSTKLHVTFMSQKPIAADIAVISAIDFGNDQFKITPHAIYLYCPNGYGNTKLTNTFFEKKLKVNCTTRNWNTVQKLKEQMVD